MPVLRFARPMTLSGHKPRDAGDGTAKGKMVTRCFQKGTFLRLGRYLNRIDAASPSMVVA
jgi:hypothetical protein